MRAYARIPSVNDSARERLVGDHIEFARRIAMRVARRVPTWMSSDDLVAAALLGLTEAAERYDSERGEPFIAFAEKRIRGAVLDELRSRDMYSRRARSDARRVGAAIRTLEQKLGRAPEDTEIAQALDVPLKDYHENLEMLTHTSFVDYEVVSNHSDPEAQGPSHDAERKEMVGRLRECLHKLPERDAQILSLYYVEELSYHEIGDMFHLSESRICQLHGRAVAQLRQLLTDGETDSEES